MGIPWEENPKIQKAQLLVTLGVLAFLAVAGALAGEWQVVAICALVVAGLALCWGVLALALIATLKTLAKADRQTEHEQENNGCGARSNSRIGENQAKQRALTNRTPFQALNVGQAR